MLISYPVDRPEQARPHECACRNRRFHSNGRYFRIIAGEWIYHFLCTACGKHVSMVPSTCIPYKHHPISTIEPALEGRLTQGKSGLELEREHWVYRSTIYRWSKEFSGHLSVLATEGARRLGIKPLGGSIRQIYQRLKQHYSPSISLLDPLQVDLCRTFPLLGIFRPLIS